MTKPAPRFSPKEVADIVFQKPERITNGILPKRPLLQKIFEAATTWRLHETQLVRNLTPKHVLVINTGDVALEHPHPRALGHAMRELRALGLPVAHIQDIKRITIRLSLTNFDENSVFLTPENAPFPPYNPASPDIRHGHTWNDDAFLGCVPIRIEGRKASALANTCYSPALEDYAHDIFIYNVAHQRKTNAWLKVTP